jgi:hypothetical protein
MLKRLRVYLDLELAEEDPEGEQATNVLREANNNKSDLTNIVLFADEYEFAVSDLLVHGLVDEARP